MNISGSWSNNGENTVFFGGAISEELNLLFWTVDAAEIDYSNGC